MRGRLLVVGMWLAIVGAPALAADVTVYKSPTCGCCTGWVKHMEKNGFKVKTHDVEDVTPYKQRYGVSPSLASCHTAVVDGYVIEGHVPAGDIRRLLKERPKIAGLAVPGMPASSPGMDAPGNIPYDTLAIEKNGGTRIYARH